MHITATHRCFARHIVLASTLALLAGCGDESLPENEALSAREVLGLEAGHVAVMSVEERATLVRALEAAWPALAQLEGEVAPSGDAAAQPIAHQPIAHQIDGAPLSGLLDAPALMARIRSLDAQRDTASLDPLLLGALSDDATLALELPLALEALLEPHPSGLWQLTDAVREREPAFDGYLVWDDAWGSVEQRALGGRSERDAIEALEPVVRLLLDTVEPGTGSVRVVPAPRAPLLVWYASANRAVLVNPTLLYLLAPDQDTQRTLRREHEATRALGDAEATDAPRAGSEHELPGGIDAPPRLDGLQADGGGSSTCDWDPCGDAEKECSDSLEDVLIIVGLVLVGIALIAGIVLLIIFL